MIYLALIIIMFIVFLLYRYYNYILNKIITKNFKNKKYFLVLINIFLILLTINMSSITSIIMLHLIVINLITSLIFYILHKFNINKLDMIQNLCIIPIVITAILMIYGYNNMFDVREHDYDLKTNKEISKDYEFVFLSDLHYGVSLSNDDILRISNEISSKNYDFVILGGDIVDENTTLEQMQYVFKTLGNIKTKYGIYYIYGNHDTQQYSTNKVFDKETIKSELSKDNIKILEDEVSVINNDIALIGRLDKSYNNRKELSNIIENIDKNKYLLVLDHQPLEYNENEKLEIDLQLSGHTHAGQIFPAEQLLELVQMPAYGLKKINSYNLIVTAGIAGWAYPIRTSRHSEYIVVKLSKG